jgi:hypothetical protein
MKNQYFADINDYRKYGLLRILAGNNGELKVAICWMLTNNDGRTDGKFINYLVDSERWRKFDPYLFESLALSMKTRPDRSVKWVEENSLITSAVYFSEILVEDHEKRQGYFDKFQELASNTDLVFYDPDNGIEVKSVKMGRKGSSKYVYWSELTDTFAKGKSLLVYQHFVRENRELFTRRLVDELCKRLEIPEVITLSTANVLYLLIPQSQHRQYLIEKCKEVSTVWDKQIQVGKLLNNIE